MQDDASFRFSQALLRVPAASCVRGLRAVDAGEPDVNLFREQHEGYVAALRHAGLEVSVLPADERFPDSVFVEDPVLCLPECALLLRSGAASRRREAEAIAPAVREFYGADVHSLPEAALADGGDILVTDREILVGLSNRTNPAGAAAIRAIVSRWHYPVREVATPAEVLHFKSDCATLGGGRILATNRLAGSGVFDGYDVLEVPAHETAAANAIRVNDTVIVAAGFEDTATMLQAQGFAVETVRVTEAAKLDAGLSCMSLRFSRRSS